MGNTIFTFTEKIRTIDDIINNTQNICNMIGREEYDIPCIVFSVSILYSFTKKSNTRLLRRGEIEDLTKTFGP